MKNINRREFIKSGAGMTAAAITLGSGAASLLSKSVKKANHSKMIGIQIGAPSFVDEGVEGCLDSIQERGCVNTLFLMTYSYKQGLSGRSPWTGVDHGRQHFGPDFHGGFYATIHPEYYKNTLFKNDPQAFRAPDVGGFDVLASVLPAAKKRGIKTVAWLADQIHDENVPQLLEMREENLHGHKLGHVCLNNPHYQAFTMAMIEDCLKSYDVEGLLWRSERWGGLTNALRWNGTEKSPPRSNCFCPHCVEKGKKQGINVDRVREGYKALEKYVGDCRADRRPPEGYYAAFWRVLLRYPEILTWDMFWYNSLREMYKHVYTYAKSINSKLSVGCAIPHSLSYNPFYRAIVDLPKLSKYNDFVKIIFYHSDGGPRACHYVDGMLDTYLKDLTQQERLDFVYDAIMGHTDGSYEAVKINGLAPEYVYKETKTWVDAAKGTNLKVLPGIDIDVSPENSNDVPRSRENVRDAVLAAFRADPPGVILARMYSEMMLDHLSGAGDAIRQLGFG